MIQPDNCRVFLANLSWNADEQVVRELANQYGEVADVFIPKDFDQDRHRGMAFVGTSSPEAAAAIVKALEGFEHMGRHLRCELARPRGG